MSSVLFVIVGPYILNVFKDCAKLVFVMKWMVMIKCDQLHSNASIDSGDTKVKKELKTDARSREPDCLMPLAHMSAREA